MQLLRMPLVALVFGIGRVAAGGFIELFVFVRREPRTAFDLALPPVWVG